MKKSLFALPILLLCALAAACGGADQNSSDSGGNGGKGGSGASSNGGNGGKGGENQGGGGEGGGNQGGGGGNQGGGGEGGGNQGGGGEGGPCGGLEGTPCSPTSYCDYADNSCAAAEPTGTCMPKPEGCPGIYAPVCACDGEVYGNACLAAAAGHDVNLLGGCPSPDGYFPCGPTFCAVGEQYCQIQVSDVAGIPDTYSCLELRPNCMTPDAICNCLSDVPCGANCTKENGGFTLTCPGG